VGHTTVFRAGALGDFVVTMPALRELAAERGPLRFVGNATAARELAPELFCSAESIDEPAWAGLFDDDAGLPEPRGEAVVLLRDPAAAGRLRRRGWMVAHDGPPFPTKPHDHVAEHLLAVVGKRGSAERWQRTASLGGPDREGDARPVIHAGSGSSRKNWPPDRFAALARRLHARVIAGPAEDARPLEGYLDHLTRPGSLTELVRILGSASFYVGNDSGVSHVAGALGVPTVAIFGPTRAVRWSPWGPHVQTVEPPERCERCRVAEERPAVCRCVERVTVDQVLAAVDRLRLEVTA
jgi:ADP-heptose:LPS heptosyltransferase